jgi:hypothetical protein
MLRSREREDLTAAQRKRLEAHLASCKACADAFTPLEAPLAELLRDEAEESARRREEGTPGETFRLRLEKRLHRAGSDRWGWHLMRSPTPLGLRMPQALAGTLVLVLVLAVAFWMLRPSLEHEEGVRVAEIPMPVKKEAREAPPVAELQPPSAAPLAVEEAPAPAEPEVCITESRELDSRERVASLGYSGLEEQKKLSAAMEPTAVVARRMPVEESPQSVMRFSPGTAENLPVVGDQFQDLVEQAPGVAVTDEEETVVRGARTYGGYEASRVGPQPASPRASVGMETSSGEPVEESAKIAAAGSGTGRAAVPAAAPLSAPRAGASEEAERAQQPFTDRLRLEFQQGTTIRLQDGKLVSLSDRPEEKEKLEKVTSLLEEFGVDEITQCLSDVTGEGMERKGEKEGRSENVCYDLDVKTLSDDKRIQLVVALAQCEIVELAQLDTPSSGRTIPQAPSP